jgi:hypothetical protein
MKQYDSINQSMRQSIKYQSKRTDEKAVLRNEGRKVGSFHLSFPFRPTGRSNTH